MRWGQGWGCFWSDPSTMVIILDIQDTQDGCAVTFVLIQGYSQFVMLVIDGVNALPNPVYVEAGKVTTLRGSYNFTQKPHLISVEPMGPFASSTAFDVTAGQINFSKTRSERLHLEITAVPEQFSVSGV